MNNIFADIHCHPSMQPYSNAFPKKQELKTKMDLIQPDDANNNTSPWYYNPPTIEDRLLKETVGITHYSQSDFTTLKKGNVRLIFSSLYPIEKGFFKNKLGTSELSNQIKEFFCGISENKIDYVINNTDYFSDLCMEYDFLKHKSGVDITIDGTAGNYVLVKNANEIDKSVNDKNKFSIAVINTIEGMHSFGSGLNYNIPFSQNEYVDNIIKVKNWENHPLFITFAHHFYNQLCGHCESLQKIKLVVDQTLGMGNDYDLTLFGSDVIDVLLNKTNGKRILIDIKHMSRRTRYTFYKILDEKYKNENIPIVASHAAVTGDGNSNFYNADINFSGDELIKIKKSNGLFGIMLEKERLASKGALPKGVEDVIAGKKIWSKIIWEQIKYIALYLDKNGFDGAWDIQCIGSDYDGIINPINHYITHEDTHELSEQLIRHAKKFMNNEGKDMRQANRLSDNEIIDKVMFRNAYYFAINNY
ncbi:MAG: membrane dipeptidase [Bacteroidales bacterium]|nr:membrane dipeptidase [Bacteroidales bacterium]